jgi:hypothetical protein
MIGTLKFQKWWEFKDIKLDKEDSVNDDFRLKPHSGSGLTLMISVLRSALKFTKRVSAHETPREAAKNPRDDVYPRDDV